MQVENLADLQPKEFYSLSLKELLNDSEMLLLNEISDNEYNSLCGVSLNTADIKPGWIFVATKGLKTHGAKFWKLAQESGAVAIVTDQAGVELLQQDGCPLAIYQVENPRNKVAEIAAKLYDYPSEKLNLIGVTGTNGKTTTAYMIRQMLADDSADVMISGTVSTEVNKIVIPSARTTMEASDFQRVLAVAAEEKVNYAVVEVSSHALDQDRVHQTRFRTACFTNLSPEHLDYHLSMDEYFAAKSKLFTDLYSDYAVICLDTDWGQKLADQTTIPYETVVTAVQADTKLKEKADWQVLEVKIFDSNFKTEITIKNKKGDCYKLKLSIPGRVNVQNAVVAFVTALHHGVPANTAIERLEKLQYIPGRMVLRGGSDQGLPLVVVDFAHTPDAVAKLLESVRQMLAPSTKINIVISHDGERQKEHRFELGKIAGSVNGRIWVTDSNPRFENPESIRAEIMSGIRAARPDLNKVVEVCTWRTDALREAILACESNEVLVVPIKGEEPYQEIRGVKHHYNDTAVVDEVLKVWRHLTS